MTYNTEKKEGIIFDIQRCSMYDGPGIRTTVFLKGCPLSCKWCHNPESQSPKPQLAFYREKCVYCQVCHTLHPLVHNFKTLYTQPIHDISYMDCTQCGKCVECCPTSALKIFGQYTDIDALMNIIIKDRPYYAETGGGLTVSGGEPFSQPSFLLSLLKQAKLEGISTCVETCGFVPRNILAEVMPYIDIFLFDYKETSPQLHKYYTAVDNVLILDNLDFLYHNQKRIVLRCPIVPGFNDTPEHFNGIAHMQQKYPQLSCIEIMPYHDLGKTKAQAIGKDYTVSAPTAGTDLKNKWREMMESCNCNQDILNSF